MIILGIDPGTTAIGYALLEVGPPTCCVHAGTIPIRAAATSERLAELHQGLGRLLKEWGPAAVALERIFFSRNQKTALAVAEARGVILLTTTLAGILTYEYTPLEMKKAITGDGAADKLQVQKMLRLSLPETRTLRAADDVFDAIGLALTCSVRERPSLRRITQNGNHKGNDVHTT